jgi:hypothetical protein
MRPFMMPIFFYGGQISKALESPSLNAAQQVALTEIRSLLTWLLMQVRGCGCAGGLALLDAPLSCMHA